MRRNAVLAFALTCSLAVSVPSVATSSSPIPIFSASSKAGVGQGGTRLILLGTAGGPLARKFRSQPANLLVVDGHPYLIDSGDGVERQLTWVGVEPGDVTRIFLTHLHLDHTAGLASLIAFNRIDLSPHEMAIYGPPGSAELVRRAEAFLDIPMEAHTPEIPPGPTLEQLATGHDVDVDGPKLIYQDEHVRVTAVANSHFDNVRNRKQSYGAMKSYSYRFDTRDRSIVFTGDTGPSGAVEALAHGADILVSEVISLPVVLTFLRRSGASDEALKPTIAHMQREHLTPEEVGQMASKAGVKMVVLSHFSLGGDDELDMTPYTAGVRRFFSGAVVPGKDFEEF